MRDVNGEDLLNVAQSVQSEWAAAFARGDWPALAALYDIEVSFYGSTKEHYTDRSGVLSYFESLPSIYIGATYATPHVLPLAPGLFAASGLVVFVVKIEGKEQRRLYRMSQVLRLTSGGWRIAVHHASSCPS